MWYVLSDGRAARDMRARCNAPMLGGSAGLSETASPASVKRACSAASSECCAYALEADGAADEVLQALGMATALTWPLHLGGGEVVTTRTSSLSLLLSLSFSRGESLPTPALSIHRVASRRRKWTSTPGACSALAAIAGAPGAFSVP